MSFIGRAWRGQEKLRKVYWYGILARFILSFIVGVATASLGPDGLGIQLLILAPFYLFFVICVWRCAFNARWKIWGYILRTLIVLSCVGLVIGVVGMASTGMSIKQALQLTSRDAKNVSTFQPAITRNQQTTAPTVAATASPPTAATATCQKRMTDYAVQQHADPVAYVAQNQAYLQQCVQSLSTNPAGAK